MSRSRPGSIADSSDASSKGGEASASGNATPPAKGGGGQKAAGARAARGALRALVDRRAVAPGPPVAQAPGRGAVDRRPATSAARRTRGAAGRLKSFQRRSTSGPAEGAGGSGAAAAAPVRPARRSTAGPCRVAVGAAAAARHRSDDVRESRRRAHRLGRDLTRHAPGSGSCCRPPLECAELGTGSAQGAALEAPEAGASRALAVTERAPWRRSIRLACPRTEWDAETRHASSR
jgi:hypothetical protein